MGVVFASPHSGTEYPNEFLAASRLSLMTLRRAEDSFVDELFADAPGMGAPLLRARFPRAYVDPNREPYELDPTMFAQPLPAYVNSASPRVAAGLGTIARLVANGEEIYSAKLDFAEACDRLESCYRPYHRALNDLIEGTRARFGFCLLIDCHSMPSVGGPMEQDAGRERVDFVLGDRFASSCGRRVVDRVERVLRGFGYAVARNTPYSGGFVTQHYGRPADGLHALQIEINRSLYMDELAMKRGPGFDDLRRRVAELIGDLSAIGGEVLAA
jgi:N-formylglutamate amidohydrolase